MRGGAGGDTAGQVGAGCRLVAAAAVAALQDEAFGGRAGQWEIDDRFHFGGFARRNAELDGFIADFADRHGLTLDWVYVAKMMYGIYARAWEGALAPGTTAVAVIIG